MNYSIRSIIFVVVASNEVRDSSDEGSESSRLAIGKRLFEAAAAVLVKRLDVSTHYQLSMYTQ